MTNQLSIDEFDGAPLDVDPPADPRHKAVRDRFVNEYLVDFDPENAARRVGFTGDHALNYSRQFMGEPYVVARIKNLQLVKVDEQTEAEYNRARIKSRLMKEAHYMGPGSSQAARVAALATLARLNGMEPPKKIDANVMNRGGVMVVPAAMNIDDWERAATESQQALIQDAGK